MILCLDVDYRDNFAQAAGLVFEDWPVATAIKEYTTLISPVAAYEPGSFYKRELPCLLALINQVEESVDYIIVDGYVWLNETKQPGLGAYLFEALPKSIPVIGVAKNAFRQKNPYAKEIRRGESDKPLFVTSVGVEIDLAVTYIGNMHGNFRIPTLLKKVDQLARY